MEWIETNLELPIDPRSCPKRKTYLVCTTNGMDLAEYLGDGKWSGAMGRFVDVLRWATLPKSRESA